MDKLTCVEPDRKDEIILAAIQREWICVLTVPAGMGWKTYKSRFLASTDDTDHVVIAVPEAAEVDDGTPPVGETTVSILPGQRVGVSFRRGHKKCMFSTVVQVIHEVAAGDDPSSGRIELRWPDAIQEFQRRVYQRATPPGRKIFVRFWPGGVAKRAEAEDSACGVLTGVMQDLSAGGIRIRTTDVSPDVFDTGAQIGCAFTPKPRGEVLVVDAVFRHFQQEADGTGSVGLQFVGLEVSDRGKAVLGRLARVVTDYQRDASRQQRNQDVRSNNA